jgi:hypothetical protein
MRILKSILASVAGNPVLWPLFKHTLIRLSDAMQGARRKTLGLKEMRELANTVSPDLRVLRGVFEGMVYPQALACGSALTPKLLGCYESELNPVVETICRLPVHDVYDIGCAEGYYAVGLAMRMENVRIHAYDIDSEARQACFDLAVENGVAHKVDIRSRVDQDVLLRWRDGCVIISDCEGYEAVLFDQMVVKKHKRSYFLIEVHDTVDPEISVRLRSVFASTHDVSIITSVDDLKKADTYDLPELEGLSRTSRLRIVTEHRPRLMDWFWCVPKSR